MARHARCSRLGSKSSWLDVSRISYSKAIVLLSISEGIYIHIHLSGSGEFNTWKELFIYSYVVAGNSSLESSTNIYIYIYIYIYCHPRNDCFIVSQLFIVARHIRCFKVRLKPGWLCINRISYRKEIMEAIWIWEATNYKITVLGVILSIEFVSSPCRKSLVLCKWYSTRD